MRFRFCLLFLLLSISHITTLAFAQNALDDALKTAYRERTVVSHLAAENLRVLNGPRGRALYGRFAKAQRGAPSRVAIVRSLTHLRRLLRSPDETQFIAQMRRDFVLWQAAPDTKSSVHFTGYFEPIYEARTQPDTRFRWPIYRLPNFRNWPQPHPTRLQLEGADGQHQSPLLRGHVLAYLPDRFQAYLVQVQGSAKLRFPDKTISIGYAGRTNWDYTGIGRELINDGKFSFENLTQQAMLSYFRAHPTELNDYLPRNRRFVFLRPTNNRPVSGALGVPLMGGHSIASDKNALPPGALALISVPLVNSLTAQIYGTNRFSRLVFDGDTGGAIKGQSRVDIFMGSGPQAGERAGAMNAIGSLYYLILKSDAANLKSSKIMSL